MNDEERIEDAMTYIAFIKSMATWGHGPKQVAEEIERCLKGEGLPEDCLAWLIRRRNAAHLKASIAQALKDDDFEVDRRREDALLERMDGRKA